MTSQAVDHRRATAECAGEVRAGRLEAGDAQRALIVTVTDLFAGGRR